MMDSGSVLKYMLALILLSTHVNCDPSQNVDALYTLYNSRRGENTVIRVQPERKIPPGYGYAPADQEALYHLYNGGVTQIDFPQTDGEVYLAGHPVTGAQHLPLQQVTGPSANDQSIAQLQLRQKQLQQSQQLQQAQPQIQQPQPQLSLQSQENKRGQQLAIQIGSTQQAPNPQKQTVGPLPTAVYGLLIKQQPNPNGAVKSTENAEANSTPLHRPESRIIPQAVPQQPSVSNNVRLSSGLQPSSGLPVLPPIFGVHNGVLGKVPLPFPNVPAYSLSQYGNTPQQQPSIGNEYINAPSETPAAQKESKENVPLINVPSNEEQFSQKVTPGKQLPVRNVEITRTHPAQQPQTVYFDDEKDRLTPSISYKNPVSSRPDDVLLRKPSPVKPNEQNQGDQLKLLSSFQNQEKTRFQDDVRGRVNPSHLTSTQQQDLAKLPNFPAQVTRYSQTQPSSINNPEVKPFKEQPLANKPRIRNQNEEYPLDHNVDHFGVSDESDYAYDDYSPSHRDVQPKKKATFPDSIQEPVSTTTLAPTSPTPVETVSHAPVQPDYSQNYESPDNTNEEEEDVPPSFFSDEDRFGSRISKGAQDAPTIQQQTLPQVQPAALLSAQLSVQESQSSFPAAALTPTQIPSRIGIGHNLQQQPHAFITGGPQAQLPQASRNILSQPQPQLHNVPNIPYQQGYRVQQQTPPQQGSLKRGHSQHSATAYNQESVHQLNNFQNQGPLLTQQQPSPSPAPAGQPSGLASTGQQAGDDLDKKQTQEAPRRQRGRRRKNRQRGSRNRQPVDRTSSNNEKPQPVREVQKPIPQYQQQQQYAGEQGLISPLQPHQNVPPTQNNRPGDLSSGIGYPANHPQTQNLQTTINPQQSGQRYSHGTVNDPSQYFTRHNGQQLPNSQLSITPNLVSFPDVTTKPSTSYRNNQETEAIRHENPLPQAPFRQTQQRHPQYNVDPMLNPQGNYQGPQPQNYPSSYNVPTPGNAPSLFPSNNAVPPNPSLYRQDAIPQQAAGGYRSDLSQQQSTYDVSSVQQTRGIARQQSSLNLEEDKPVPTLLQTTTPSPVQEVTTARSTNRSRFGQRRKGRGRSRQQKNRSRNVIKENAQAQEDSVNNRGLSQGQQDIAHNRGLAQSQGQQDSVHNRGLAQSQGQQDSVHNRGLAPLQQQGHVNDPQTPQGNQPFNQQFKPPYNPPIGQQQLPQQNPAYTSQAEQKPKRQFVQQQGPQSNTYGREQQQQHSNVPQQYSGQPQQYNPPQQLQNYQNVQKPPELGTNLQPNTLSPQLPYQANYGQQQPQLQTANLPQNAGNNQYHFQPNYGGQGSYQATQSGYPLQPNGASQFYKRVDAEVPADDDYADEGELDDGEEYKD